MISMLKPCESDLAMMRKLSRGYGVVKSAEAADYTLSLARKRIRQLKARTGTSTLPHLNYMIHCNYWLDPLNNTRKYERPSEVQLQAVQGLAWGKTIPQMALESHITVLSCESRLVRARRITGAKNNVHLVTLCWSRDFIV